MLDYVQKLNLHLPLKFLLTSCQSQTFYPFRRLIFAPECAIYLLSCRVVIISSTVGIVVLLTPTGLGITDAFSSHCQLELQL